MEIESNENEQYIKMTETPIPRLVITLGIPTTISMLITNIYNMADTFFVGNLGTSASGAIGVVFGFMSILQAFGFMFGQGAGSIISRKLGEKNKESASIYASVSFFLSLILGSIISVIGFIFMDPMLRLFGSTSTILPFARSYVFYILLSGPLMMSSFVMNNIIRFEGKASFAMIGLVAGALLNIIGDPIFMFKFKMGIAGAGVSTALSQFVSFLILLSLFLTNKTQSKLSIKYFKVTKLRVWQIISTGLPSLLRQGLTSISTMLLNHFAGFYGDPAVAAMSIVSRINFFMFAVGLGMGQGFQPVCGYNYGARKFARVRKAYRFTLIVAECMLGIMAVIGFILSPVIIGWFRDDSEVIAIGKIALSFQCFALFFQPLTVMSNMLFQSSGQRKLAAFSSTLRSGLFFIPILLITTKFIGLWGIESSQAIADILSFIAILPLTILFFKKIPAKDF